MAFIPFEDSENEDEEMRSPERIPASFSSSSPMTSTSPLAASRCSGTHTLENHIQVHTSILFDPISETFLSNQTIHIDKSTGTILKLTERSSNAIPAEHQSHEHHATSSPSTIPSASTSNSSSIDLRGLFVTPGLVDSHTHIFLHAYSDTPALVQMRDESWVERTLRGVNHAKSALRAGFTTYRDLGTEGMGNSDANFRDAINRGIIEGPRMFVACEPMATSGGYETRLENRLHGSSTYRIADSGDGATGVKAAVRRQIAAGADFIKFYADYRKRQLRFPPPHEATPGAKSVSDIEFPPTTVERNPAFPLFDQEEMDAIVREAHLNGTIVAAHSTNSEAAIMAAKAGVRSIEHGPDLTDEAIQAMKDNNVIFVPTLATMELYSKGEARRKTLDNTKRVFDAGVPIAAGGDTGAFAHGDNARELEILLEAGLPLEKVLLAATHLGWQACGAERCGYRFGSWVPGAQADIAAFAIDPRHDKKAFRKVDFVMKDGRIKVHKGVWVADK